MTMTFMFGLSLIASIGAVFISLPGVEGDLSDQCNLVLSEVVEEVNTKYQRQDTILNEFYKYFVVEEFRGCWDMITDMQSQDLAYEVFDVQASDILPDGCGENQYCAFLLPFVELNPDTGMPGYYVQCRVSCIPYNIGTSVPVEIELEPVMEPMAVEEVLMGSVPTPPQQTAPVPNVMASGPISDMDDMEEVEDENTESVETPEPKPAPEPEMEEEEEVMETPEPEEEEEEIPPPEMEAPPPLTSSDRDIVIDITPPSSNPPPNPRTGVTSDETPPPETNLDDYEVEGDNSGSQALKGIAITVVVALIVGIII